MKNKSVFLFIIFSLICFSCGSKLPLVLSENIKTDMITVSIAELPDIIDTEGMTIKIDFKWNYPRLEFEAQQKAASDIKYTLGSLKFCGGLHDFDWPVILKTLPDSGYYLYHASSKYSRIKDTYAYGNGRLAFGISCSYTDKNGNSHGGSLSNYLDVPVIFVK